VLSTNDPQYMQEKEGIHLMIKAKMQPDDAIIKEMASVRMKYDRNTKRYRAICLAGGVLLVALAIGEYLIPSGQVSMGNFMLFCAAACLYMGTYGIYKKTLNTAHRTRPDDVEWIYEFSGNGIAITSEKGSSHVGWTEINQWVETPCYFFLIWHKGMLGVAKNAVLEGSAAELKTLLQETLPEKMISPTSQ